MSVNAGRLVRATLVPALSPIQTLAFLLVLKSGRATNTLVSKLTRPDPDDDNDDDTECTPPFCYLHPKVGGFGLCCEALLRNIRTTCLRMFGQLHASYFLPRSSARSLFFLFCFLSLTNTGTL